MELYLSALKAHSSRVVKVPLDSTSQDSWDYQAEGHRLSKMFLELSLEDQRLLPEAQRCYTIELQQFLKLLECYPRIVSAKQPGKTQECLRALSTYYSLLTPKERLLIDMPEHIVLPVSFQGAI